MNKNLVLRKFQLLIFLLLPVSMISQTSNQPQVTTVFAVLTKSVESKTATAGEEFSLRTISDVAVNGEVVIPRESKMVGHVAGAITKGKDERQSMLSIVIDKAIRNDGVEIPLQGIIAAVAAPQNKTLSSDPTYGMMHSNEPKMVGAGPGSAGGSGGLSAPSKSSSTAAVATADLKGRMDEGLSLNEDSQGAIGYDGISISWNFLVPPPITLFSSKGKNVKLEAGTTMLLRMAPPRLPS